MQKSLFSSLIAIALLSACGGGGSDAPDTPAAVAPVAETTPAPTPTPTAPALVEAPVVSNGAITINSKTLTQKSSGFSATINFTAATNLTLVGNLNSFWIGAAEAGGSMSVEGDSNTLVLKPTATPTTVTVTGSANTFYLPEGSPIGLTGTGAAMSSVKYYKP